MQGLDDTSLTEEAECSINFIEWGKEFCFSLHKNASSNYLFVAGTKIYQFKAKDSKLNTYRVCLENFSKYFSNDTTKLTGLNAYVYDFSFDFRSIYAGDIIGVGRYYKKSVYWIIFGGSLAFNSKGPIKCVSLSNQLCQAWSTLIDINSNEALLYPSTADVNKHSGSWNTINDAHARVGVPNKVKNMILKVYYLNIRSKWNKIFISAWIMWL